MDITPREDYGRYFSWGKDGGLGTWSDSDVQGDYHGLTGGTQTSVLAHALERIYAGDMSYLHTLGDAWSHSYVAEDGSRMMFGKSKLAGQDFFGTLEHAVMDEHGHMRWFSGDPTDKIEKRADAYSGYLQSLATVFANEKFAFHSKQKADLEFFNYVQQNGGSKDNNVMLLKNYVDLKLGVTSFTFEEKASDNRSSLSNRVKLWSDYLSKAGIQHTVVKTNHYHIGKRWVFFGKTHSYLMGRSYKINITKKY